MVCRIEICRKNGRLDDKKYVINSCKISYYMLSFEYGTTVSLQGVDLLLHRWEVVRMKYDFKDLMSFGMFILALLTLIVMMSQ